MSYKITCLIIDDEPVARNIIRTYCAHLPIITVAGEFGNALDAKAYLAAHQTDLLFLDIHLPVLSGIGFLSTFKNPPQVIFTTAYQEYAVNAFDLAACDYLVKPFSLERFMVAVDKARDKINQINKPLAEAFQLSAPDHFFVKAEGKIYKIATPDFLYAEAQGNYTRVVTAWQVLLTKTSFSAFMEYLPSGLFIRVHRSFIINQAKISHIEGNRVFIGKQEIPIAVNYRASFFKLLGI
jgi:DNA-binding LytR/AlgR family response regulator